MCIVQTTSEQSHNAPVAYAHIKQAGISPECYGRSNPTEKLFTNNVQPHNHEKALMQMQHPREL